jgi:phosphatidylethanolamine-binding protein (PEBP) family uncharacterized protein
LLAACSQYVASPASLIASSAAAPAGGFTLHIPAFGNNPGTEDEGLIAADYTCDGTSASPPLAWSGEPPQTQEFCIICWHVPPDYTEQDYLTKGAKCYWILYRIPRDVHSIPRNVGTAVGVVGVNEKNARGWDPFCSKDRLEKIYRFTIYALLRAPALNQPPEKVTRDVLLTAIRDVTLASTTLNVHNVRPPDPAAATTAAK